MNFEKRYLQFNDLVFDGYDMISESDEAIQYKGTSTAYAYGHGSYRPYKSNHLFVSEGQANMTITLKTKKVPCEYREFYVRFAEQELARPGKLWAIKNNEILWANASVTNKRPVMGGRANEVVFDVEFVIPDGVWHKADKQKTFLVPYDLCGLMDCKGFENYNPVAYSRGGGYACDACEDNKINQLHRDECGCCCEDITADMALGFHLSELQQFYSCDTPYQLVYDCDLAEAFLTEKAFGQRICAEDICDQSYISGRFYSDTDIATTEMTITLVGTMTNPWITINGNTNIISGSYDGILKIYPNGDVYYTESECGCADLLDPSVWIVPEGSTYGWEIEPRVNSIVVNTNVCCGNSLSCVYIEHEAITA